jgi:hypothetical protein
MVDLHPLPCPSLAPASAPLFPGSSSLTQRWNGPPARLEDRRLWIGISAAAFGRVGPRGIAIRGGPFDPPI